MKINAMIKWTALVLLALNLVCFAANLYAGKLETAMVNLLAACMLPHVLTMGDEQ